MPEKLVAFLFLVLMQAAAATSQVYVPGPQVLTFLSDVDDSDQPYAVYLPKELDAGKKYPLVISLHGAWSNHRLNLRRVFGKGQAPGETDAEATRYFPAFPDKEYIVVSPYARGTMGYQGIAEKDVYDVLADVKRRFPVDEDRIYLTGLSMGGGGALWLGLTRPDIWAAIAPVCPAPPAGSEDLAPNLLSVPAHFFHGEQDPAVSVETSRKWQKRLLDLDTDVEYIEYPGVLHNAWDYAYKDGAIFDWFAKYKRNRFPQRVRFVSRAYKYNSAYWVHLDGLTPGILAAIDARFTSKNHVTVITANLDGFTLKLEGHPSFVKTRPVEVTLDGTVFSLSPRDALSFKRAGDSLPQTGDRQRTAKFEPVPALPYSWKAGRYMPPAGSKRPGLEGPIAEVIASRHIYVYGTSRAADKEEVERRHELAAHAAEWSAPHWKLQLSLEVMSDQEIPEREIGGTNLVLFGTKATNKLIQRFEDRFPLELNAGAADYGLVFIAPVNGHDVVVNSGIPFWTGAEAAKRPGLDFIGTAYQALNSFPDYILFKGSLENVIAEGRFDRNWRLPPGDAAKMKATGAVEIHE
jgi:pimeloyl-ACP methyl ester carboxylesterase